MKQTRGHGERSRERAGNAGRHGPSISHRGNGQGNQKRHQCEACNRQSWHNALPRERNGRRNQRLLANRLHHATYEAGRRKNFIIARKHAIDLVIVHICTLHICTPREHPSSFVFQSASFSRGTPSNWGSLPRKISRPRNNLAFTVPSGRLRLWAAEVTSIS